MNNVQFEERVLSAISYLQEFYDGQEMWEFFHECGEYEHNGAEAFLWLEEETMICMERFRGIPEFKRLRDRFAQSHKWKTLERKDTSRDQEVQ